METIDPRKLLVKIASIFDKLGIDYFITGGMAVSMWGRPRATFDIDAVVKLMEPQIPALTKSLKRISKAGYVDEETAKEAIVQGGEFNFIDPETGLKVDFWITGKDQKTHLEFKRRISQTIFNRRVFFISPEDLILNKLLWYNKTQSSRHKEDIESIFKIQKKLDLNYLKKMSKVQSIFELLEPFLEK